MNRTTARATYDCMCFFVVYTFIPVKPAKSFSDVPKSHPYYDIITTAQRAGIFDGSNGKFEPNASLTRGQLSKVLVLAAGFTIEGDTTFKDTPASYWGTPYISTLASLSIVKGTDGLFNPYKPVTRAQFVSMTSLTLLHHERLQKK